MKLSGFASRLLPAIVLGCGMASASTIVATGVDGSRGGSMVIREVSQDGSSFTDVNGLAGVILITLTDGGLVVNRDTLCVDLFTNIYENQTYNTNVLRPEDVPQKNLQRASWLVDNYLLPAKNPVLGLDMVTSAVQGMGMQFAIWDIVHDNGDGFFAGRVQAGTDTSFGVTDSNVLIWAQTYESLSLGKSSNLAFVYNNVTQGTNPVLAQMLIGPQFADRGPQPVPEPQTLLPAGLALIALSLGLRKRIGKRP